MGTFAIVRRIATAGMFCWTALLYCHSAKAQFNTLSARAEIKNKKESGQRQGARSREDRSDVALWLIPLNRPASAFTSGESSHKRFQLVQENKRFHPHVLMVPVGALVNFPNRDPFFHNVFSLFDGKRFDLGLYEAGATNSVRFDRPGVSFLFCNIHPEMSAVVIAVETPYYGLSDRAGNIKILNVPDGEYEMHIWYERSLPEDLKALTKTLDLSSATQNLGTISVPENPGFSPAHKNKYGQDYPPPPSRPYSNP